MTSNILFILKATILLIGVLDWTQIQEPEAVIPAIAVANVDLKAQVGHGQRSRD